jgi:hypothetical protein
MRLEACFAFGGLVACRAYVGPSPNAVRVAIAEPPVNLQMFMTSDQQRLSLQHGTLSLVCVSKQYSVWEWFFTAQCDRSMPSMGFT